jgi:hypothetical protein
LQGVSANNDLVTAEYRRPPQVSQRGGIREKKSGNSEERLCRLGLSEPTGHSGVVVQWPEFKYRPGGRDESYIR